MNECIQCGNPKVESNGLCASCAHAIRKAERMQVKDRTPVNKVSEKHGKDLNQYAPMKKKFLLGKWCAVHGKPCLPNTIHHMAGRVGFIDDWARERNIPALLDIRYWLPACLEGHQQITDKSAWAVEQGFTVSRLSDKTI